jgi:hypothetical protein
MRFGRDGKVRDRMRHYPESSKVEGNRRRNTDHITPSLNPKKTYIRVNFINPLNCYVVRSLIRRIVVAA